MAWNPFARRASSKMPGTLDEIDDYNLKEQSKAITDIDSKTRNVSKSLKRVAETRENLHKATERLIAELSESPTCNYESDLQIVGEIGQILLHNLKDCTETTNTKVNNIRSGIKLYRKNLQSLLAAVKKHESLASDVHQLQAKCRKYEAREMSNANAHKLETARKDLDNVRQEHSNSLASLRKELPEYLAFRSEIIGPCLQLLAGAEHEYSTGVDRLVGGSLKTMASRTTSLGNQTGTDLIALDDADGNLSTEEKCLLDEIKSLSIVIED